MQLDRILLTTDFTPCSRHAYPFAADLARGRRCTLDLCHVLEHALDNTTLDGADAEETLATWRAQVCSALARETEDVAFRGIDVRAAPLAGRRPDVICRHAREAGADLICQASHGDDRVRRWLIGSFATAVLRHSTVPVLTLKCPPEERAPATPGEFRPLRILYPHDLSDHSRHALDVVRYFARRFGAHVTVLHVWKDLPSIPVFPGGRGDLLTEEMMPAQGEPPLVVIKKLRRFVAREFSDIDHGYRVARGDPATVIVGFIDAGHADLVCLTTHGRSGLRRALLGSVAEKVVAASTCPVLTVRVPSEALEEPSVEPPRPQRRGAS